MGLNNKSKLLEQINIQHLYDADGTHDGTTPTMIDMQGWDGCLVLIFGTVSAPNATDHLLTFKVTGNSDADGGGTDHTIASAVTTDGGSTTTLAIADIGTGAATTLNSNFYALDIRADQMTAGDRYIGAETTKTGTFEITIAYIRYNGDHLYQGSHKASHVQFQLDA